MTVMSGVVALEVHVEGILLRLVEIGTGVFKFPRGRDVEDRVALGFRELINEIEEQAICKDNKHLSGK